MVPVRTDEGWGEVLFHGPHPPSETAPSRRKRVILEMMDSATPPCGCAQNDGIAGSIQVSDGIEGSLHSCSYGADFTHLTLAVCEQHEDRAEKYVIAHFLSSCASVRWICPTKNHLFTK